jgi:glucokinase
LTSSSWAVVGLDNGATSNSATLLDDSRHFLVDRLVESPSRVREGPDVAVEALVEALDHVLVLTGVAKESVRAVGLGTPGPASADGVISSKGVARVRLPRRARASPRPTRHLQQRR